VAGVSGNGQRELMEALVGQRERAGGGVHIGGEAYLARREQNQRLRVRSLPEEPLRNASVGDLRVAPNIRLPPFDPAYRAWTAAYAAALPAGGRPVRTGVGVTALVRGALIGIEAVAKRP